MGDLSGRRKRVSQRERNVRTQKGRDRVRGTHHLGTTDGGTRKEKDRVKGGWDRVRGTSCGPQRGEDK